MNSFRNTQKPKRRHSLSGKLLILFVCMALLFLIFGGHILHYSLKHHFEKNVRPHFAQYLQYVQQDIGNPPNRQRAQQLANKLNIEINIIDDTGSWSSHNHSINLQELEIRHHHIEDGTHYTMGEIQERDYLIINLDNAQLFFHIPEIRQERQGLKGLVPLIILSLILLILYQAIRYLFAPIITIQEKVKRIGAGDLTEKLNIQRRDELGILANDINTMADDIQKMLDAKRQLLLAISHELRSPLTRAKVATELLGDNRYQQQIKKDLDDMEALITEIIETERLNTQHRVLEKQSQDIVALIQEIKSHYFIGNAVQLNLPTTPILLNIDIARIKLLFKNLIDNALRHTPKNAAVEIDLSTENEYAIITIRDHGKGIANQHIPLLTEPFYRVDPARQRETGGYGLGLYLCKIITEAHGGQLKITSKIDKGTTVTILLPIE